MHSPAITSTTRASLLPLLAAGITIMAWASGFVAVRHLAGDVSSGALALGRIGSAALALSVIVFIYRRYSPAQRAQPLLPRRRHLPLLTLSAILWFGIYHLALNQSVHYIDAGTAALVTNTAPIIIAVLAGLFLREGFSVPLLVGMGVALIGVIVISMANSSGFDASLLGIALCLVCAVTWAVGVVAQKPLLDEGLSALNVTWWSCVIGALMCLPFAVNLASDVSAAGWTALWWTVYLGVIPTALGFTTWAWAVTRMGAGRLAGSLYLVPPTVILMGWVVLAEVPPAMAILGGALCLLGVAITRYQRRNPAPRQTTNTAEDMMQPQKPASAAKKLSTGAGGHNRTSDTCHRGAPAASGAPSFEIFPDLGNPVAQLIVSTV
ncbi:DMT family transporter [Natronoglycomyces albus]|uniref:DMT family transporter n=1 Tax=Natronoglycomyces albus TaxID=2811108 RepID=A0A895XJZ2_9ACTN|nr:DMT family transporter [Natronoglycomyces albus]QSB04132.1 DMT family transporter [Natronoglycomyces albus]